MKPTSTLLFAAGAAPGRMTQADEMRVLLINRIAEEFGKGLKQSRRQRLADFVIDKAFEAVPPGGSIGKDTVGHLEMQAREKAKHLSTLPPTPPRTLEGQLARGRSEREERKVLELRKERKKAIKAVESIGTTAPPSLVRLRLEIFEAARRRAKEAAQIAASQAAAEEEDRWRKQFELPDPNASLKDQNGSNQLPSQPPFPPSHPSSSMSDSSAAALRTTRLNIALREAESTLKMRSEALKLISSAAVTKKAEWQYAAEERERQVQLAPSRKASDARQRIRSATLLEEEALIKRKKSMSLLEQAKLDCMRAQEQYDMLHTLIGRDASAKEAESNRKKQSAAETEKRREQMGLAKKTSISSTAEARRLRSISAPPPVPGPDGSRPEREIEAIKRDDLMNAFKSSSDYLHRRADAVERQAISDSWRNSISGSASRTSTFLGSEDDTIEYLGVTVDAGLPGDELLIPSAMEQQRRARASYAVNALLPLPRNLRPRTDAAYEAALREAAIERVKEINMKAKAKDQAIKDYVNASRVSQRLGGMAPDASAVMLAVEGVVVPPILPPHKPSRRVVKLEQLLAEQKAQDNMTFFQYRGDSQYAQDGEEMAVEGLSVPPAGAPSLASENAQSAARPRRSSASGARYSKWFSSNPIFEVLDLEGIRKRDPHSNQSEEAEKKNDRKSSTSSNVHDSSGGEVPSVETIYETARASLRTETSAFAPTVPAPALPPPSPLPPTRALSIHPGMSSSKLISDSKPLSIADENIKERLYLESSSQTLYSTGHHSALHSAHAVNAQSSGGGRARDALFVAPPPAPMQAVPRPRMSIVNKNEWQTTEDAAQSAAATEALVKGVKLKKKQSKFTSMGHDREEVIEALISRPSSLGRGRKAGSSSSSFRSFGATSVPLVPPARKARKVNINMVENVSLAPHLGLKPFPSPTPLGFSPVDRENHIITIKPLISETLIALATPKSITQQPLPASLKTPFHTL